MKKFLISNLALILLLVCFNAGCGSDTATSPRETGQPTLTIVTSFYPLYIMTLNLAQDLPGVKVVNLTSPVTGCLHDYQLNPEDLKALQNADILVINGAGMESFMEKVYQQKPGIKVAEASRDMDLLVNGATQEPNPHIWVSISGAIRQVQNLGEQLAVLDPPHAAGYRTNSARYVSLLEGLKNRMHRELQTAAKSSIITFHEAFPYFAREFDLNVVAVIEREPGSEPSPREIRETIELIRSSSVKALFAEPQYPDQAASVISQETKVPLYTLDPAVTGPMLPDAYIKIMESNLEVLKKALAD